METVTDTSDRKRKREIVVPDYSNEDQPSCSDSVDR